MVRRRALPERTGLAGTVSVGLLAVALALGPGCTSDFEDPPSVCGDGVLELDEGCDDGNLLTGDGCGDECDVEDGWTCVDEPSQCDPLCGDGLIRGAEVCDGTALGGTACADLGFASGSLSCDADCAFDTSACVYVDCGNGVLDAGEACDTLDFGGQSCVSLGFDSGVLACDSDCQLNVSQCIGCGNSIVETGEDCDGTNLGGQDCTTAGYLVGTLSCADCALDTSQCFNCGPPTAVSCPVSILSDDFNDGQMDPIWSSFSTGTATTLESTTLRIYPPTDATGFAAYRTAETYDLRYNAGSGSVSVMVLHTTNLSSTAQTFFNIVSPTQDEWFGVGINWGSLQFAGNIGGAWAIHYMIPYDEVLHRYWRLSAQNAQLTLETSSDGVVWTIHATVPQPFPLDDVYLELMAGTSSADPDPGYAEFEDFNILP